MKNLFSISGNSSNKESLWWHIAFWLFVFWLYMGIHNADNVPFWATAYLSFVDFPLKVIVSYLFILYIIPESIKRQSWLFLVMCILIIVPISIYINGMSVIYLTDPLRPYYKFGTLDYWSLGRAFKIFTRLYGVVFAAVALKFTYQMFVEQAKLKEIKNEQLAAEMKYLKDQINPHFIFNTLNSIYSMVLSGKKGAADSILKLSDLMSYLIYDAAGPTVSLSKEIEYIINYIDLEKTRHEDRLNIQFKYPKNFNDVKIPSLITLPLIENSFKHGLSNEIDQAKIIIELKAEGNQISLFVSNSKPACNGNSNSKNGFGLQNLKKRMELLFGENYSLSVTENEYTYSAVLYFNLLFMVKT